MANRNGGFIGTDGLDAPDPPTAVTPTIGNEQVSVAFTAPTDTGTSAITGFVAQVSTDGTNYSAGSNTGSSSPIVVSSLTNGTAATAKVWAINAYGTSAPSDASASFTPAAPWVGTRGVWAGGYNPSSGSEDTMEYVTITTTGNATDFGNLSRVAYTQGGNGVSNGSRGVFGGITNNFGVANEIEYITFANTGNSTDFGDLTVARDATAGMSSGVRGVFAGGTGQSQSEFFNVMDYITIASTGNATDFGDLSVGRQFNGGVSNGTRGAVGGGETNSGYSDVIDYITIASAGNATDFGNLTVGRRTVTSATSETRGIWAGGDRGSSAIKNEIDYVTISSTGNASDFGNLLAATHHLSGTSSTTRAVIAGGKTGSAEGTIQNVIQYIEMASTGNASDFGDLSGVRQDMQACSGS